MYASRFLKCITPIQLSKVNISTRFYSDQKKINEKDDVMEHQTDNEKIIKALQDISASQKDIVKQLQLNMIEDTRNFSVVSKILKEHYSTLQQIYDRMAKIYL